MFQYIIPSVNSRLKLERHCPICRRFGAIIHSSVKYRGISDIKITSVPQMRMKCPYCKNTWTIHPKGITDGRQRSDRLIAIGVVLYNGLSG